MSVIDYLFSGGMVTTNSSISKDVENTANGIAKQFGNFVRVEAKNRQIPALSVKVLRCTYLFVGYNVSLLHFVFADASSTNSIVYRDLTANGYVALSQLEKRIQIEIGEPIWSFSCPLGLEKDMLDRVLLNAALQYLASIKLLAESSIMEKSTNVPAEIASGIAAFRSDYPSGTRTAFVMMCFKDGKPHSEILNCIKQTLSQHGVEALRADDKQYMDDLFPNVKTYMHGCDFGIAVFDRIIKDDINPNVSLEVGYMLGLGKSVLLLKDKTLKTLQTDLAGKLYKEFDSHDIAETMPAQIEKWLRDKGIVAEKSAS